MKLTLGFSPCPNDTFIFDAIVNKRIDTEGLDFDITIADVEELNLLASKNLLDITKVSYHAFCFCIQNYILLDSGSALGTKCGPLLIKKKSRILNDKSQIAIPGELTTANMLFSLAFPDYQNRIVMSFSEIESAILDDRVAAGVIIHENRFTFRSKGLIKVMDLGDFWEKETGLPIPLGGIVIKRVIPYRIQKSFERVLRNSITYALENPDISKKYVASHAQEIDEDVIQSHINLYVNPFSISLREEGRRAVNELLSRKNIKSDNIFVL